MRVRTTALMITAVMCGALAVRLAAQQADRAEVTLRAAMTKQLVEGKLDEAIDLYKKVVASPGVSQEVAAKAFLQMAQCYEKQGKPEALPTYQRIVSEYANSAVVASARSKVAELQATAGPFKAREMTPSPEGTLSPDGKWVAFGRERPERPGDTPVRIMGMTLGGSVLYVRPIASASERVLFDPADRNAQIGNLRWSPDSQRLAFTVTGINPQNVLQSTGELRLAVVASGVTRAVATVQSLGNVLGLQWSPDSERVAFAILTFDLKNSGEPPKGEVRIVTAATGESRTVASVTYATPGPAAPALVGEHVWSPDSKRLAYHANQTDEIRVVTIASGESRSIAIPASKPGGRTIVADWFGWTTRDDIFFRHVYPSVGTDWFLIAAGGGEARKICESRGVSGGDPCETMTPDGAAVVTRKKATGRLMVRNVSSGSEHALTAGSAGEEQTVGLPSPDGRLLVFKSNRDGRWALYVAPISETPVQNPVRIVNLDGASADYDSSWWTKDGQLVVRISYPDVNVYRIDLDPKTGRTGGAAQRLTVDAPKNQRPAVSPDGQRIAYWYQRAGKSGIAIMDASGGNERPVLDRPLNEPLGSATLFWRSADQILFPEFVGAGDKMVLATVNIRTGTVDRSPELAISGNNWTYVPTRNEVIYQVPLPRADAPGAFVLKARVLGSTTDRVVATIDGLTGFAISPDGRRLAYSRFTDESVAAMKASDTSPPPNDLFTKPFPVELRLMALDGADDKSLLKFPNATMLDGAVGMMPMSWSPDGQYLLYRGPAGGFQIMSVETAAHWSLGANQNRPAAGGNLSWSDPSWSPSGSFIVLTRSGTRTDWRAWEGITFDAVRRAMQRQ